MHVCAYGRRSLSGGVRLSGIGMFWGAGYGIGRLWCWAVIGIGVWEM